MKTTSTANIGALLLVVLVLFSCKKESMQWEALRQSETVAAANSVVKNWNNQCRLTYFEWPGVGTWQFHYNSKGLADKWTIDYGFDVPVSEQTLFYDNENRLIRANEVYFNLNYIYLFTYKDKRINTISRTCVEFPDERQDFKFTYNSKGQNIRQDDAINDQHVLMFYDAMGNCTKTDIYIGKDLWVSDNYQFSANVRNPLLNIPGIEIGFPFYGGTIISNKSWFTSNRTVIYEVGIPFLYNDYDPSRTTIITGNHNFPNSAHYYDAVSESSVNMTFGYYNCNGTSKTQDPILSQLNQNSGTFKKPGFTKPILFKANTKSLKEKILKMRPDVPGKQQ